MSRVDEPEVILEPLPYHIDLREYLKSEERELWSWFASAKAKADYTENLRLELLKSTYRLDLEGHPDLHQSLNEAKTRLHLDIPVTLYQAQNSLQLNAALYYIPGQGHIVFSGPLLTLLNADEVKSVIGHELSGDVFTVRFGRIGTLGQSQTKRFPDEAKAQSEADHLIAEKLKKGYVEKK